MVANVGEITYTVDANTRPLLEAEKVVDQSTKNMSTDFNKVDSSSKKLGGGLNKLTKSFKLQKNASQQLGFQLQDIAVQLQSGTRLTTVFSQQGSQLAGVLGPGGALLGAVIAISGALAGVLIPILFSSTGNMKKLSEEADELRKSLASLALFELTDAAFKSAERVSELEEQLRKAKIRMDGLSGTQMGEFRAAAEAAKEEFKNINRELIFEQNTLKQINAQSTVALQISQGAQESFVRGLRKEIVERDKILKGQKELAGVEAALDLPVERLQRQFEKRNDIIQAETEKGSALQQDLVIRNAQLLLSQIGAINEKELQQEQTKLAALNKMRQEAFTTATAAQLGITEQTVERLDAIAAAGANASLSLKDAWANNMLDVGDSIGDTLARAIVDGESLSQTLRGVAKSFLTEMLSSLIKVGAQMVINQAIGTAGAAAATATAVAAGSASAAAWAPAAALASLASFGANAAPAAAGIASTVALSQGLALAGGKLHGGPVGPGRAFPVAEDGRSEIFSDGNRQFLIPGSRGEVISNGDMRGGGEPAININFNVQNSSPGASFEVTGVRQQGTEVTIDAIVSDIRTGNGPVSRALGESTNVTRKSI
jgi:hypothetical protein